MITSSLISYNSIIKNKLGLKHAQFFGFTEDEIKAIKTIEIFMPLIFRNIHRIFMQNFIRKMKSNSIRNNRIVWCINQNQLIFPCYLYLDFSYQYKDDFCINAILTKIDNISRNLIFNHRGILNGV